MSLRLLSHCSRRRSKHILQIQVNLGRHNLILKAFLVGISCMNKTIFDFFYITQIYKHSEIKLHLHKK